MIIPDVNRHINNYLLTRDIDALYDAISTIEAEMKNPSLQLAILELDHAKYEDVARMLSEKPILKFSLQHVTDVYPEDSTENEMGIKEGQLIRVAAKGQPEGSFILMEVVHMDKQDIVLYVPGMQGVEV